MHLLLGESVHPAQDSERMRRPQHSNRPHFVFVHFVVGLLEAFPNAGMMAGPPLLFSVASSALATIPAIAVHTQLLLARSADVLIESEFGLVEVMFHFRSP
jgi:hypothetical protein